MQKAIYAVFGSIIFLVLLLISVVASSDSSFRDFFTTTRISALAENSSQFERDVVLDCIGIRQNVAEYISIKEAISKMAERRPNWRFILLSSDNEFDEFDSVSNVILVKLRNDYSVANASLFKLLDFVTFFRFHNKLIQLRTFNKLCIDDQCKLLWVADAKHLLDFNELPKVVTIPTLESLDVSDDYLPDDADDERDYIKNAIKISNKVITLSEFSKQRMIELLGVSSDFVHAISLKVGSRYSTAKIELSESVSDKYKIAREKYLIFIPEITTVQNQKRLIEAFDNYSKNANNDIKLLIICPEGQVEDYRKLVATGARPDNTIIAENVSEEEKNMLMYNALAFVQPSLYDGSGSSIIKAMFMELPILCSNTGSLPEVASGAALLFNPFDVDDIRTAIFKIVGDEDLRTRLTNICSTRRNDFQNIEMMADEYLNVFEEVMNETKTKIR